MGHDVSHGSHPDAWQSGAWERHAAPRPAGEPAVRRLTERDRPALETFLDADPGYTLFLRGNLRAYSLDGSFLRYWGMFDSSGLRAAAMLVAYRATLYAPSGIDVRPLARTLSYYGVEFTMGRTDLVDSLLAALPDPVCRREEHYFAAQYGPPPTARAPHDVVVRRATVDDLDALTRLYIGSEGFERLSPEQVRRALNARLRSARNYVALAHGSAVAAASTSAETERAAMIGGVWTDPSSRGCGYSTAVVAALCRELIEDHRVPYLFYLTDNAPAARVYAKNGFRTIGRWSIAYLDRDEAIHAAGEQRR